MAALTFVEPSGAQVEDPSADWVIARMREGDPEYWGPYSPYGWLKWHAPPPERWLILLWHPRRGVS